MVTSIHLRANRIAAQNRSVNVNDFEDLARRFRRFAELECRGSSPLYEWLSTCIADDSEVLELAAFCNPGQPAPNLFLGAAHLVLLENSDHPLSAYYASMVESPKDREGAFPHFRSLCLDHRERIAETVSTRMVQTNEVGRCAVLLPAFAIAAERSAAREAAFVEVGASAGLNLLWDRFHYEYGEQASWGDSSSPVRLACEPRGEPLPAIPDAMPGVAMRVGIDLAPVDVGNADAVAWLRALIWPEHRHRVAALEGALRIAASERPTLIAADALDALPGVLDSVPHDRGRRACTTPTRSTSSRRTRAADSARFWTTSARGAIFTWCPSSGRARSRSASAHCSS